MPAPAILLVTMADALLGGKAGWCAVAADELLDSGPGVDDLGGSRQVGAHTARPADDELVGRPVHVAGLVCRADLRLGRLAVARQVTVDLEC